MISKAKKILSRLLISSIVLCYAIFAAICWVFYIIFLDPKW